MVLSLILLIIMSVKHCLLPLLRHAVQGLHSDTHATELDIKVFSSKRDRKRPARACLQLIIYFDMIDGFMKDNYLLTYTATLENAVSLYEIMRSSSATRASLI